jgi:PKD repeat protein
LTLGPDGYFYYVALNPDPSGPSEIRRVLYTSAPSVQVDATPTYGEIPLPVHFTSTLSTHSEQSLTYAWTFGDGGESDEANPVYTYTTEGTYTAALTVTTAQGKSSSDQLRIFVGESPPTPVILTPTTGLTYTMGTSLTFRGAATDAEDGAIPAAQLQWNARIFYNGHFHPDFFKASGVTSGTLQVPLHNDNTWLFVFLTAEDSQGLQRTAQVELFPQTATYTFTTVPSGLRLTYDGTSYTTPFTIPMMVNAPRTIAAPLTQNGLPFAGWSDGGAASHQIVGEPQPQTLTAVYAFRTWLPLVLKEGSP